MKITNKQQNHPKYHKPDRSIHYALGSFSFETFIFVQAMRSVYFMFDWDQMMYTVLHIPFT